MLTTSGNVLNLHHKKRIEHFVIKFIARMQLALEDFAPCRVKNLINKVVNSLG